MLYKVSYTEYKVLYTVYKICYLSNHIRHLINDMRILFPMLFINIAYFRTPESKIKKKE